jgi:hypothetical protein
MGRQETGWPQAESLPRNPVAERRRTDCRTLKRWDGTGAPATALPSSMAESAELNTRRIAGGTAEGINAFRPQDGTRAFFVFRFSFFVIPEVRGVHNPHRHAPRITHNA